MIQLSVELHQWSRAILTDVQAAELAAENAALKAQVKRLRKRLREEPSE
jgi:regulator of replication initiation timing